MRLKEEQARTIYRQLKRKMTLDEKIWLMDFQGNLERYQKRLLKLAEKYEITIEENKEK